MEQLSQPPKMPGGIWEPNKYKRRNGLKEYTMLL